MIVQALDKNELEILGTEMPHPATIACIPAFNEEKNIAKMILLVKPHVDKVIVCDDGSEDLTGEIASDMGALVIRHERNRGYGEALATLFNAAWMIGTEVMVTIDGDCQHDPEDICKVIEPVLRGDADIVIGSRFLGEGAKNIPQYRKGGIRFINELMDIATHYRISDTQSGFRAYNRKAIGLVKPVERGMGASTEILLKAKEHTLSVKEVPIAIQYHEKPKKDPLSHGLDVVFSTFKHMSIMRPLYFYGFPGLTSAVVGLCFWVFALNLFAQTRQLSVGVTLVALAATIVGMLLLTTAVILWVLVSVVRDGRR